MTKLFLVLVILSIFLAIKYVHTYWAKKRTECIYKALLFNAIGGIYGGYLLLNFSLPDLQTFPIYIGEAGLSFLLVTLFSFSIGTLWWRNLKW